MDQASADLEAELQIRLRQTNGRLARAIEEALSRIRVLWALAPENHEAEGSILSLSSRGRIAQVEAGLTVPKRLAVWLLDVPSL